MFESLIPIFLAVLKFHKMDFEGLSSLVSHKIAETYFVSILKNMGCISLLLSKVFSSF